MKYKVDDEVWVAWLEHGEIYIWNDIVSSINEHDNEVNLTYGGNGPWKIYHIDPTQNEDCVISHKRKFVERWALGKLQDIVRKVKNVQDFLKETIDGIEN